MEYTRGRNPESVAGMGAGGIPGILRSEVIDASGNGTTIDYTTYHTYDNFNRVVCIVDNNNAAGAFFMQNANTLRRSHDYNANITNCKIKLFEFDPDIIELSERVNCTTSLAGGSGGQTRDFNTVNTYASTTSVYVFPGMGIWIPDSVYAGYNNNAYMASPNVLRLEYVASPYNTHNSYHQVVLIQLKEEFRRP